MPKRTYTNPHAAISRVFDQYLAIVSDPAFRGVDASSAASAYSHRRMSLKGRG